MTKKIWKLLCILAVFLAGMLLYAGGVLFFRYQARREGLYAWIAGGSAAIFFLSAFIRAGKEQKERYNGCKDMLLTEGASALLAVGMTGYVYRFQELSFQLRIVGIVFFWAIVFIWKSLFSKKSQELKEENVKEILFRLFPDLTKEKQISENPEIDRQVNQTLIIKRRIWELRWCIAIFSLALITGLMLNYRNEWKPWGIAFIFAAGFAWLSGRDRIYTARTLSDLVVGQKNHDIVNFFLIYYSRATRRCESMTPMLQIYLPIALCQLSEYDKALELLKCMKKRPEEEAYYLVWEAEIWKQKEEWKALKQTLDRLRDAIPHLAKSRRMEIEEKYRVYERTWREKVQ